MNDDIKPSDFFGVPEGMVCVPKKELAILLDATKEYWREHMRLDAKAAKKEVIKPFDTVIEAILADQVFKATTVLYAGISPEDRLALIRYIKLVDKSEIPPLPKPEDLF